MWLSRKQAGRCWGARGLFFRQILVEFVFEVLVLRVLDLSYWNLFCCLAKSTIKEIVLFMALPPLWSTRNFRIMSSMESTGHTLPFLSPKMQQQATNSTKITKGCEFFSSFSHGKTDELAHPVQILFIVLLVVLSTHFQELNGGVKYT